VKAFLASAPDRTQPFFTLRARVDAGLPFVWHFHREFELTSIVDSEGTRFVGDSVEEYRAGDLVLTGPLVPHSWSSKPREPERRDRQHRQDRCVVAHFGDDVVGAERLRHPTMIDVKQLLDDAGFGLAFPDAIATAVGERMRELPRRSPLGQLAGLLDILDLLAGCHERRRLATRRVEGSGAAANDPIARVLEHLNAHYVRGVSLDEAAEVAAMSTSAFARAFRRATGKTLTKYLNDVRIAHACQLILETDRTMADIADSAGFGSVTYFNRRFRLAKKLQPSEYRRRGLQARRAT
jgi:AraC-like DNA-binding protein